MARGIDRAALFEATPSRYLVLGPDLVIVDVNRAYLEAAGRTRGGLVGQHIFQAFPYDSADPEAEAARDLSTSLHRVLATGEPEIMPLQKFEIPVTGEPGNFKESWWSMENIPVPGADGRVAWIIQQIENVTAYVEDYQSAHPEVRLGDRVETLPVMEAEHARARGLQRLNEELRRAHLRERETAVTLQEAMLQTPDLGDRRDVAVRYLPAVEGLNVGGDWYDVVDLSPDHLALAVGDVVGHGPEAAAVMGMLRSALSATVRILTHAALSLEAVGLFTRSVEGALGTTAVNAIIDTRSRLISYSCAGHPPPMLAHVSGGCELLDQATDPPLGARPWPVNRPQASIDYQPGDTLVLYTDGLVERRGEDIDIGLNLLHDALTDCALLGTEQIADALLARLGVAGGGTDDIALIVARL